MSGLRTLSVDIANEDFAPIIKESRHLFYDKMETTFWIERLVAAQVSRDALKEKIEEANSSGSPYEAIVISAHGSRGIVHNNEGELFSEDDSPDFLRNIAEGRIIYICACNTMDSLLSQKLLRYGAKAVIGFTQKPTANTDVVLWLWETFDIEMVASVVSGQTTGDFRQLRQHYIKRAEALMANASEQNLEDLLHFVQALKTMVIKKKNA